MEKNSLKITSFELDVGMLPPLTPEQQAELEEISANMDSDINYSEIPPISDTYSFYRAIKKADRHVKE